MAAFPPRGTVLLAGLLLLAGGCQPSSAPAPLPGAREIWNACYIGPAKVGYERVTLRTVQQKGQTLVVLDGLTHLAVQRFQDATVMEIRYRETETVDGKLLDFETTVQAGPLPQITRGRVVGDQLRLEIQSAGKSVPATVPWSGQYGGFLAVEQSLEKTPMQPGERRQIQALIPGSNQVGRVELEAQQYESVKLLDKTAELLRIETVTQLSEAQSLRETCWTDRSGEILRRKAAALDMEAFRTTQAVALAQGPPVALDLGESLTVPVQRPLERPHETKRVQYRVQLRDADPVGLFVAGPSQQVDRVDPHTALVTVYALRPGVPAERAALADAPPTEADRQPNNFIQSDDPEIVAAAKKVAEGERDPWKVALALEGYVRSVITEKDYTQAFATASEVLRTHKGDCTEHAVLLAALARAQGIPARVAMGLVYMPDRQAFGYHMWTEVFVQKQWLAVDGTLARGGIGAAHLKLAQSSLEGAGAYNTFLPIAEVAGKLQLEIVDVQ